MPMPQRARKAMEELRRLGVPVWEWGAAEGYGDGVAFVFHWSNEDKSQVFADQSGQYIRETVVNGYYVNPLGYRQDVHDILKKHRLVTDWANAGQIVVYKDPDAAGWPHARSDRVKRARPEKSTPREYK